MTVQDAQAGRLDRPDLRVQERLGVLHVTLNRPDQRNALSSSMFDGLIEVAAWVARHPGRIRAVVLSGAGGSFCAGGDLEFFRDVFQGSAADADSIAAINRRYGTVLTAWDRMPTAVIAAIEGAAMAGGMGLAAIADVTLATAASRFALTETRLGLVPAQISPFVIARIGAHQARRLMLTGASFDAAEAARLGLVDEVVADSDALDASVQRTLSDVLRCAPLANALSKFGVHRAADLGLEDLLDESAERFARTMQEPEAREGVASFFEKRRPSWFARPATPSTDP